MPWSPYRCRVDSQFFKLVCDGFSLFLATLNLHSPAALGSFCPLPVLLLLPGKFFPIFRAWRTLVHPASFHSSSFFSKAIACHHCSLNPGCTHINNVTFVVLKSFWLLFRPFCQTLQAASHTEVYFFIKNFKGNLVLIYFHHFFFMIQIFLNAMKINFP